MNWIKHLVRSGDNSDIDDAMSLFGSDAYYVFFRTLEVMAQEFDPYAPGVCVLSVKFMKGKFRTSWQKTTRILEFYSQRQRIIMTNDDSMELPAIRLNCPKFTDLCDEYATKLLKKCRDKVPTHVGTLSALEVEEEVETTKANASKGKASVPPPDWKAITSWWNDLAKRVGLTGINKMTDARKRKWKIRLRQCPDIVRIMERELPRLDSFVYERNWLTFDWVTKSEDNLQKLAEGKYRANAVSTKTQAIEWPEPPEGDPCN